jgi:hypothetical protein
MPEYRSTSVVRISVRRFYIRPQRDHADIQRNAARIALERRRR